MFFAVNYCRWRRTTRPIGGTLVEIGRVNYALLFWDKHLLIMARLDKICVQNFCVLQYSIIWMVRIKKNHLSPFGSLACSKQLRRSPLIWGYTPCLALSHITLGRLVPPTDRCSTSYSHNINYRYDDLFGFHSFFSILTYC